MLKIAVLAPMQIASVSSAVIVKVRSFISTRAAKRASWPSEVNKRPNWLIRGPGGCPSGAAPLCRRRRSSRRATTANAMTSHADLPSPRATPQRPRRCRSCSRLTANTASISPPSSARSRLDSTTSIARYHARISRWAPRLDDTSTLQHALVVRGADDARESGRLGRADALAERRDPVEPRLAAARAESLGRVGLDDVALVSHLSQRRVQHARPQLELAV